MSSLVDHDAPRPRCAAGKVCSTGRRLKVLLVEDNPADAITIERQLVADSRGAATVVQVDSLTSTLLSLTQDDFDAIFLDLNLPDSDGLETAMLLLQQALTTPIVVVSSEEMEQVAIEAVRLGAQDYLSKSRLRSENLYRTATHAIERQSLRLALERRIADLERKRQNFRSLIADNADAMIVMDSDGKIRFSNRAAEALMGRSKAALEGSDFGQPLEGTENSDIEIVGGDGRPVVVDLRVMNTTWEGEPAYIATLRDVTEHKEAERMLRVAKQSADLASQVKTQFLANISHELRTPLNAIMGFAELLLMEVHGPLGHADYGEYLKDIRNSGRELTDLINRLLDLSKAQAGALTLQEQEEDLHSLLETAVRSYHAPAAEAGLRLTLDNRTERCGLFCDAERLKEVIDILLSNSLKFTERGGEICLSAAVTEEGILEISIADNGRGMPREQVLRAFSAFERPDGAYSTETGQGAGLGLALAKTLVELHAGIIRLDSDVGRGTRATILLPAARLSAQAPRTNLAVLRQEGPKLVSG